MNLEYVTLVPLQLPANWCPSGYQEMHEVFTERTLASFPEGSVGMNMGSDLPGVNDRGRLWARFNSDGSWDALFFWWGTTSQWLTPLWHAVLGDVKLNDGPGPYGVGWVAFAALNGRSPMGTPPSDPVPIPDDVDHNRSVSRGDTLGEGAHKQTPGELVSHTHAFDGNGNNVLRYDGGFTQEAGDDDNPSFSFGGGTPTKINLGGSIQPTGGGQAMNVVHPVYGIPFLKFDPTAWNTGKAADKQLLVLGSVAYRPHTLPPLFT